MEGRMRRENLKQDRIERNTRRPGGQTRRTGSAGRRESAYVYDSLAREVVVRQRYEEEYVQAPVKEIEDGRRRADIAFVIPATLMVCAVAAVFILYIFLTAQLTRETRAVAALKVEVNRLHDQNIEERNRIDNSIDPMTMKYICMDQLGMVYPEEGQVISYNKSGFDYMRQVLYND